VGKGWGYMPISYVGIWVKEEKKVLKKTSARGFFIYQRSGYPNL